MDSHSHLNAQTLADRLQLVESIANTGFWTYDVKDDTLFWDKRMFELYDTPPETFTGKFADWESKVHPDDLEAAKSAFDKSVETKGRFQYTFRVVHRDDTIKHLKAAARWTNDLDGKPTKMIGVNVDYTEEIVREQASKEAAQLYKMLIEQSPYPTAMFDREMRYIATSQKWIQEYGLEGSDIIGVSHYDIFPEITDDWKAVHQTVMNGTGKSRDIDAFLRGDGRTQYLRWNLQPWYRRDNSIGGIIMFTEDITERVLADQKNQEIYEHFTDAKALARIGVWEVYLKSGISYWDEVVADIYKTPLGWYPKKPEEGIAFYKEGESREKIIHAFDALIHEGKPYHIEVQLIDQEGTEIWVRTVGNPVYDETGKIIKASGLFQDIDKQKKAELEKDVHIRQVELMSERLSIQNRSLMDFAHITSHNLRAPVGNLVALSELYHDFNDKERAHILENMQSEIRRLSSTLDDLIEILVIRDKVGLALEKTSFEELMEKIISGVSQALEANGFKIETDFSELEAITSNKTYIESIFLNLVTNAIKYRKHEVATPYMKIKSSLQDSTATITFEDNGSGIDLDQHGPKVFGLYKTFHKNADAKGVGLFMVKAHVEALNGTIDIESELNKGSKFTIRIPTHPELA